MLIGKNATSSGTATTDLVAGLFALALAILFAGSGSGVPQASKDGSRPGGVDPEIPVFAGGTPPYADTGSLDGRLRPAVGVHNFKVIRANRTHPGWVTRDLPYYPDAGFERTGFTYNHQPMLSYWKGRFWVLYQSGPAHEHQPPCYALITWSQDGRNWEPPRTMFPAQKFPNRKEGGAVQYSISHQRMGWYVAPDGRLIASAYYGMHFNPNDGKGVGRVVREVYGPDDFGPSYWVRYGTFHGYSPSDSPYYPYYATSQDTGFVKAVEALLADKLVVQQWYEEDQDNSSGLFAYSADILKAFCWYTRPDGKIVGMWKSRKMAVGNAWKSGEVSRAVDGNEIYYGGAKIWGQRTSDGRYALVYNPVKDPTWRHPLAVTTSADGRTFDTYFLNVHSETPAMRFSGSNKDGGGGQYVRGIVPGNGVPPDGAMWLTYSCNKEDVFVARVPVPIRGTVDRDPQDDFESMEPGGTVTDWNVYTGTWNPVAVMKDAGNRVLRLEDQDPYDYACAIRVFPETTKARIGFDVRLSEVGHDNLEVEIQDARGRRPVRIVLVGKDRQIFSNQGPTMGIVSTLEPRKWIHLDIEVDTVAGTWGLQADGKRLVSGAAFAEPLGTDANPYGSRFVSSTVERLVFRTGIWRMRDFGRYGITANTFRKYEPDLPGADEPVTRTVVDIDNVKTQTARP